MCQKEVFVYKDEPDGYLMSCRQGVYRFQCFNSEKTAKESLKVWKEKGNDSVFVSREDLEGFFKSQKNKAV